MCSNYPRSMTVKAERERGEEKELQGCRKASLCILAFKVLNMLRGLCKDIVKMDGE